MAWHLEYHEQLRVVILAFEGDSSADDVRRSSLAVISMLKDRGAGKILTDFAQAQRVDVTTIDITLLPSDYREMGLPAPFTEAVVAPVQCRMHEDAKFYETVCVNRGNMVRVFETRDAALAWLTN